MSTIVQGCASQPKPELSSNTEFLGLGTHANARDRLIGADQHLVLAPLRQVVKGLRLVVQLQRGLLDAGHCMGTPEPSLAKKRPEIDRESPHTLQCKIFQDTRICQTLKDR